MQIEDATRPNDERGNMGSWYGEGQIKYVCLVMLCSYALFSHSLVRCANLPSTAVTESDAQALVKACPSADASSVA